jgi:hypothetical protein
LQSVDAISGANSVLRQQRQESTLNFSRSFSTVSKIFAVKQRNSTQRGANRIS